MIIVRQRLFSRKSVEKELGRKVSDSEYELIKKIRSNNAKAISEKRKAIKSILESGSNDIPEFAKEKVVNGEKVSPTYLADEVDKAKDFYKKSCKNKHNSIENLKKTLKSSENHLEKVKKDMENAIEKVKSPTVDSSKSPAAADIAKAKDWLKSPVGKKVLIGTGITAAGGTGIYAANRYVKKRKEDQKSEEMRGRFK